MQGRNPIGTTENSDKTHGQFDEGKTYLEGYDGDRAHTKVDHRQAIFPAQKTRIEEANPRYHDPYESSRG